MAKTRLLGLILCLAATAVAAEEPAAVQTPKGSTGPQATSQKTEAVAEHPDEKDPRAIRLGLQEAIVTAVKQNLGVELQNYEYRMAGYNARAAYGLFDWNAFASLEAAAQEAPVTSVIFSPKSDRNIFNIGVRQTLPTGGNYTLSFNNNRIESNNQFTLVNPSFSSNLGIAFTQPLMRDFGIDVNRRQINLARNTLGLNREAFRNTLLQTVYAVEQAYYDLIFARQNIEVTRQSLFLARDQARITQIRIDVGAAAPLDILLPRVDIAEREEQLITSEALIRNAEDRLRQLMNMPESDWDRPIVPADRISQQPVNIDLNAAVAKAYELRPEIQQAKLGTASRKIEYSFARNQKMPQLDFTINYGIAGLGGDRIIQDPVTGEPIGVQPGGLGDAFEQVYGFDFPSWTVGFNVGVPITNIGARAAAKRAELDLKQSDVDEQRARQIIAIEVRGAARDIDTLAKQIIATRTAREASEQNLDAERKRFENGMTTNFQVLEAQRDVSNSSSREIAALVAYNKAVANFHRAVGDLLEVHNIQTDADLETFQTPTDRFENVRWLNYEKD